MPLYIFARFEAKPDRHDELLKELKLVVEPTRAEPGCVRIHLYQSTRNSHVFFIQSEWTGEPTFEAHAELPHTKRFLDVVEDLITHPFEAVRTSRIF